MHAEALTHWHNRLVYGYGCDCQSKWKILFHISVLHIVRRMPVQRVHMCAYIDVHVGGSWLTSSLQQLDLPPPELH